MQHLESTVYSRRPAPGRAARFVAVVVAACAFAAAWATAGDGNGWQPPRERVAVTLPAVTVVGHRELAAIDTPLATCERQERAAPRPARKIA